LECNQVWDIIGLKLEYIPDLIWDIPSWIWDINKNSDLGCPKSECLIWDIPKLIWDMGRFGLQQNYAYASDNNKKKFYEDDILNVEKSYIIPLLVNQ